MNDMILPSRHRFLKFEPWRSEVEHATSRSRRFPTILNIYEYIENTVRFKLFFAELETIIPDQQQLTTHLFQFDCRTFRQLH